jgi:hypothetical protein
MVVLKKTLAGGKARIRSGAFGVLFYIRTAKRYPCFPVFFLLADCGLHVKLPKSPVYLRLRNPC